MRMRLQIVREGMRKNPCLANSRVYDSNNGALLGSTR